MLDWPEADDLLIDQDLEAAMEVIRSFDDAVATARQAGRRKLRWPVGEVVVVTGNGEVREAFEELGDLALIRANARTVRAIVGAWDRILWRAEPVMRAIGPAFGKSAEGQGADRTVRRHGPEGRHRAGRGGGLDGWTQNVIAEPPEAHAVS